MKDIWEAVVTWPSWQMWKRCLGVYVAFVVCALPLGFAFGFFQPSLIPISPGAATLLAFYILLRPALLEEFVFRVLLLPRDAARGSRTRLVFVSLAALAAFVAAHPLNGWLLRPAAFALFTSPIFLAMAALLGAACTLVYLISRSLWPPVLLHWVAVVIWITMLGGQGLVGGRMQ